MDDLIAQAEVELGAGVLFARGGRVGVRALAEGLKRLALQDLGRAVSLADGLASAAGADPGETSQLLAARAHVLCYATRFGDAIDLLREGASLAAVSGSMADAGQVKLAMIQPLARLGHLAEAESSAAGAAEAFGLAGDEVGRGKALLNLGIVLRMREMLQPALEAFALAEPLVAGDTLLRGALESNRAEVLLDLDSFGEAGAAFESALAAFEQAGNRHAAAIVEGNLADLLSRSGHIDEALERFERARGRFRAAGAVADEARLAAEGAEALSALGATDAAVRAYSACLPDLESASLRRETARARLGVGLLLLGDRASAEAEGLLRTVLTELESLGWSGAAARCRVALAAAAIRRGAGPGAHDEAALALRGFENRPLRLAHARTELARACLEGGETGRAAEHLSAVGDEGSLARPLRARCRAIRGALLRAEGRLAESAEAYRGALRDAEALRGQLRAEQWRLAHGESWRGLYLEACGAALDCRPPRLAEAFDAVERLRARAMLDAMGARGAGAGPAEDPQLAALLGARLEVTERLSVLYAALSLPVRGGEAVEGAINAQRVASLEEEAERLGDRIDGLRRSAGRSVEPVSLDEALGLLDEETAVVEFFAEQGQLSAMVLRGRACHAVRRFAPIADVGRATRKLEFLVREAVTGGAPAETHRSAWPALCRHLSSLLLAPVGHLVSGASRLAVCGFGPLGAAPWAALEIDGVRLVERGSIVELPSVTVAQWLDRAASSRRPAPALLAVGVSDELAPEMEREAGAAAAGHPGGRALLGAEATREAVLASIPGADMLHLAVHCHFSSRHPLLSRLKLSDGWLTVRDLVGSIRTGSGVVLAGCESGRHGGGLEEDRSGFVRALLAAGASQVLASRWPLHDETSAEVFSQLYRRVGDGGSLDRALAATQNKISSSGVSPWLWAGLSVTGGFS
ncbi:MAG: CHAT domain-containing protein [Phycisphaerales bacterium]|nr:CHAT domain-containing protein [Phycisphaerales bacterium]